MARLAGAGGDAGGLQGGRRVRVGGQGQHQDDDSDDKHMH